jgi:hypothetical protein
MFKTGSFIITAVALISCCKALCDDGSIFLTLSNRQTTEIDTVYLISYKPNTGFTERIDSIKRFAATPVNSTQPAAFMETLDYRADWKVVIPGLNKEYFINNIETRQEPCQCEGGSYEVVTKFRLNNVEKEGWNAVLE